MAKKTLIKPENKPVPQFEPGQCVTGPSLVVDRFGIAWWVNPQDQTMREAHVLRG